MTDDSRSGCRLGELRDGSRIEDGKVYPAQLPPLFACDLCNEIGPELAARRHTTKTGHPVYRVDDEVAEGVREIWREAARDPLDGREISEHSLDYGALLALADRRMAR